MAGPLTRLRLVVSGRVQGVGYRWFVRGAAAKLGVSGWAQNREDGTVEIEAEGAKNTLDEFKTQLRSGHPYAQVASMDSVILPPKGGNFFEIR